MGGVDVVQIEVQIKVLEYFLFSLVLMMVFGFLFQLLVIFVLMGCVGLIGVEMLCKGCKYVIVGILVVVVFVMLLDFILQIMLIVLVYGFYEISIWIVLIMECKVVEEEVELIEVQGQDVL